MDIEERKRLIEQTRKELIEKLSHYRIGTVLDGVMVTQVAKVENGYLFIIPSKIYQEWLLVFNTGAS